MKTLTLMRLLSPPSLLYSTISAFCPYTSRPAVARCASHYSNWNKMQLSTTSDDKPAVSSDILDIYHLKRTVGSTQDETRRLLDLSGRGAGLAVIATNQDAGRGTNGRAWVGTEGNLFLTCAIPMERIPMTKVTLLPLGVGMIIAQKLAEYSESRPTVKWPNDVLIEGKKIAGTLIENYQVGTDTYWLIGIGVNIESCPTVLPADSTDFRKNPRSPTSLRQFCARNTSLPTPFDLGTDLSNDLYHWTDRLQSQDSKEIIASWKVWANLHTTYELRETGEKVRIVDIDNTGQLLVVNEDNETKTLVADYFY